MSCVVLRLVVSSDTDSRLRQLSLYTQKRQDKVVERAIDLLYRDLLARTGRSEPAEQQPIIVTREELAELLDVL